MAITAPYNFVPLNEDIFYPLWSDTVNHDIPFSDAESAIIDIQVTAMTPIFIKNNSKEEQTNEFCHYLDSDGAKKYYIPSSSIKGMIRSVLEILSFSKIKIDEESLKEPLSVRDMSNRKELVGTATGSGLLFFNQDGSGYIVDYGKPRTIESGEIKQKYPKYYEKEKDIFNKFKVIKPYSKIMVMPYLKNLIDKNSQKIGTKRDTKYNKDGEEGILVINNYIAKKHHEFILIESDIKDSERKLSKETIEKFKNVYFTNGETPTQKLGAFWKKQDKTQGIPIFYIESANEITDIGLTQLFKLSYNKTLYEASKQNSDNSKLDLTETIFGTMKKNIALKGRVQFSHLQSTTINFSPKEQNEILGSPNPTYYPNYICQTNIRNDKVIKYTTLMDKNAKIAGYKRYPLHSSVVKGVIPNDNDKVQTNFKALDSGTLFEGKIRFHNLKKAEIGALLSAITFHGQEDTNLHNIGMAKSLGYGKISIKLTPNNLKYSQEEYLKEFEKEISKNITNWIATPQLKELFAMSNIKCKTDKELKYQLLKNPTLPQSEREKNDFTRAKKNKEYLITHSGVVNTDTPSKINSPNENKLLDISKTKMRKIIQEKWNKIFKIHYNPHHIKLSNSNQIDKITDEHERNIYKKLYTSKRIKHICKYIELFLEAKLNIKDKNDLYDAILKIK